jgi:hypothetical protein
MKGAAENKKGQEREREQPLTCCAVCAVVSLVSLLKSAGKEEYT